MSDEHLLARFRQHTLSAAASRAVQRAVAESVAVVILPGDPAGKRLLRGIPVVDSGCGSGTSPGTDPLLELLNKEQRRAG